MKEGLQVGLTGVKLFVTQISCALAPNEKLDRAKLEKAMKTMVEELQGVVNLANLHCALQTDHNVKDTLTQLVTDLDSMFNEVAEIFKKKQLNTEVHFPISQSFNFLSIPAEEGVV